MTSKTSVAYRISDQALKNLDYIIRVTGATKTSVIEMALAFLANQLRGETKMTHNHRQHLNQKFYELEVGDLEEMDTLTDDELESLTDEIKDLLSEYEDGVESDAFMDELEIVVNRYLVITIDDDAELPL